MTVADFLALLDRCPLVASVQADTGSSLDDPDALRRLAESSLKQGVGLLRMQGVENIRAGLSLGVPVIGLIKRVYGDSDVYITPTEKEVDELLQTGCEMIAMDMTTRVRPGGVDVRHLVERCHRAGRLVLGDVDGYESGLYAAECGADVVSTTLSGYTGDRAIVGSPDLDTVRRLRGCGVPVLAEGRYTEPVEAFSAVRGGAAGVVIGGALNDPVKQTRRFIEGVAPRRDPVGCVDLGGTWLRFGVLSPYGELTSVERISLPAIHSDRLSWIRERAVRAGVSRVGVSAGGVVTPSTGVVTEAKGFIPDYVGRSFLIDGLKVFALNDGLATAWGHALHPDWCGQRVATLALGSGVGSGVASVCGIDTDADGNYPRWNDLIVTGHQTVEDILGGLQLEALGEQGRTAALEVARKLFEVLDNLFVDRIVVCGGVGLSPWFVEDLPQVCGRTPVDTSPYQENAGLIGAGWLALKPPAEIRWPHGVA